MPLGVINQSIYLSIYFYLASSAKYHRQRLKKVLTLCDHALRMATTIRIDDTVRPTRSNQDRTGTGFSNGIYPYRSQSRTSSHSRSARGRRGSFDRRSQKSGDPEVAEDEDAGLRQAGDFKKRQVGYGSQPILAHLT
jgi:hypothetical protein